MFSSGFVLLEISLLFYGFLLYVSYPIMTHYQQGSVFNRQKILSFKFCEKYLERVSVFCREMVKSPYWLNTKYQALSQFRMHSM